MGVGQARLWKADNTLTPDKYYDLGYVRYCVRFDATFRASPKTGIVLGTAESL